MQEILIKVQKIKTELINSKSLPSTIKGGISPFNSNLYSFMILTARKEKNRTDSVRLSVIIIGDSLDHLSFDEFHIRNGKKDTSYVYTINKYGVIDWAYYSMPDTSTTVSYPEPYKPIDKDYYIEPFSPWDKPVMEINTDSTNQQPILRPDEKVAAKYNAHLKSTLDELDSLLFKK